MTQLLAMPVIVTCVPLACITEVGAAVMFAESHGDVTVYGML